MDLQLDLPAVFSFFEKRFYLSNLYIHLIIAYTSFLVEALLKTFLTFAYFLIYFPAPDTSNLISIIRCLIEIKELE